MEKKFILAKLFETLDFIRTDIHINDRHGNVDRRLPHCNSHNNFQHDNKDTIHKERLHHDEYVVKPSRISQSGRSILCLLLQEEGINQRTISKHLNITAQAVSGTIKILECKGLIVKKSGDINNENIISLTDEGKKFALEFDKRIQASAEKVLKDFTEEELLIFYKLVNKMHSIK